MERIQEWQYSLDGQEAVVGTRGKEKSVYMPKEPL
jgi:hypothetical protein